MPPNDPKLSHTEEKRNLKLKSPTALASVWCQATGSSQIPIVNSLHHYSANLVFWNAGKLHRKILNHPVRVKIFEVGRLAVWLGVILRLLLTMAGHCRIHDKFLKLLNWRSVV